MMCSSDSSSSTLESPTTSKSTKRRKVYGRMTAARKKINLQSHTMGKDCYCRLKCFERVSLDNRHKLLRKFNLMKSHHEQNTYLSGLINVIPVQRRRPRKYERDAKFREATYKYRVRIVNENNIVEDIEVCRNAFISTHGITKRRQSHYSLSDSSKIYVSEELNIRKMYKMYCQLQNSKNLSYETNRSLFNKEFNISFGYPRTDTCSTCDEFLAKIRCLETEKREQKNAEDVIKIEKKIKDLRTENKVHKRKAATFYESRR
ncbi:unnamed protein product [Psylliodes chrysocephalus]|uniref:Uncharacterized protein n=1 Tax=Psylliodes chrysocephalus TaxID=3402493 RepID=A0A9P0D9G6_9CUCU|nr:unnamed protein product [Psylliodes chrysocephala]